MTNPTAYAIHELVTPENVEAYNGTMDQWVFAHDLLDQHEIPSTERNIYILETAFDNFVFPAVNQQWSNTADQY